MIPESALNTMTCRSPMFLRMGCWPVSPLCTPELIRFCERLPPGWRQDKYLHRARLERLGFSPEVVRPPLRENFSHVMQYGLRQRGLALLARMLPDSILVELGYVDGRELRRLLMRSEMHPSAPIEDSLYEVINLELSLRSLVG